MRKIVGSVILALLFIRGGLQPELHDSDICGRRRPAGGPGHFRQLRLRHRCCDGRGGECLHCVSCLIPLWCAWTPLPTSLTLVAGTGTPGYSGDNGPAASAQLNKPSGMALDSAGNLYIADSGNNRVRKVSNGVITTVSGGGVGAQLSNPTGVAVDTSGNLYIADSGNNVVRKVSGGVTVTVAGTGTAGASGDGGPATSAQLNSPRDVAVDTLGNLYIADFGNDAVRQGSEAAFSPRCFTSKERARSVSPWTAPATCFLRLPAPLFRWSARSQPAGAVSAVAGNFTVGYSGDGGSATNAAARQSGGCRGGCQRQPLHRGLQQ